MSLTRQLSLFGIEARPPVPGDLAGLLAGPGEIARMGGTARVGIVVGERWRAAAIVGEVRMRGLAATCVLTEDERLWVRTPYSTLLAPLARAWLPGTVKRPPSGFVLDGRRLRLWMMAAGYCEAQDVTLRIGACDAAVPGALVRALAAAGLPSDIVGLGESSEPSIRISGARRVNRLAELVGDPPPAAPLDQWPVSLAPARRSDQHGDTPLRHTRRRGAGRRATGRAAAADAVLPDPVVSGDTPEPE